MPDLNTATNVSTGKPKVGGAFFRGATTLTLPTTADGTLASGFACLGYCSDQGVRYSQERENTEVNSWQGVVVLQEQNNYKESYKVGLLEVLNPDVQKTVFGDSNVTGSLSTGLAVTSSGAADTDHAYVIDEVMSNGTLKRTVIPRGRVIGLEEVTDARTSAVIYEVTIGALPDSSGACHYDYYKTPSGG